MPAQGGVRGDQAMAARRSRQPSALCFSAANTGLSVDRDDVGGQCAKLAGRVRRRRPDLIRVGPVDDGAAG